MKIIVYASIVILHCFNFSTITAQEEDYESISLTLHDHAELTLLNQNFLQAVKNNEITQTEQLIAQGIDINYQDEFGNTAAHYAWSADTYFFSPYTKIRGMLIIAQANLEIPNHENKTANHYLQEIKFPIINMNSNEIANYVVHALSENDSCTAQDALQAEVIVNHEFANFIDNRSFTYDQFDELIKALHDNKLGEYMQKYRNQS